jgi:hypothetical protein
MTVEAAASNLVGDQPLVVLDGWNVTTKDQPFAGNGGARIAPNIQAQVDRKPAK